MNKLILVSTLLLTQTGLAGTGVFSGMKAGSQACYGAEYSVVDSSQLVQKITTKFEVTSYKVQTMDVRLTLQNGQELKSELVCDTGFRCYIECDGGKVDLEILNDGALKLSNANFIIQGGCGQPTIPTLKIGTDGIDSFVLDRLPVKSCR